MLVWGLILAGIVVVALEGRARLAYSQTLSRIQAGLDAAEQMEISDFHLDKLQPLIAGNPTVIEETRRYDSVKHLQWKGLFKQYGLHVSYGMNSKVVTGVTSDNAPPEAPAMRIQPPGDAPVDSAHAAFINGGGGPVGPGSGMGGGGGGGGGFGGGRRRDPMESDADKDGKLARDEVQGWLAENFDEIDTGKDGFLDAEELAARFSQRGSGGGPGGPPAGPGGERQRPQLEEPPAAPATPESAAPATSEGVPAADPATPAAEAPATDPPAAETPTEPAATPETPAEASSETPATPAQP